MDDIPEWVKDKAQSMYADMQDVDHSGFDSAGRAAQPWDILARYIAQHERPPVDPDVLLAAKTAAEHGFADDGECYEACLAAIKRVRAEYEQ